MPVHWDGCGELGAGTLLSRHLVGSKVGFGRGDELGARIKNVSGDQVYTIGASYLGLEPQSSVRLKNGAATAEVTPRARVVNAVKSMAEEVSNQWTEV